MAATATSLSRGFSHICIPSSFNYKDLKPQGSTPLVDEMYSTEALQIVHDGAEMTRPGKTEAILAWKRSLILTHLRVCNFNFGGAFNRGECFKCVRTAITLHALGAFDEANLFRNRSRAHWEKIARSDYLEFLEEILAFAQKDGTDTEIGVLIRNRARSAQTCGPAGVRQEHPVISIVVVGAQGLDSLIRLE